MPSVNTVKWTNHRENRLNRNFARVLRNRQNECITSTLSFKGVRDKTKQRHESTRNAKESRQSISAKEQLQSVKEKGQSVNNFTLLKKRSDDILYNKSCKLQSIKKEKWENVDVKWEDKARRDEKRRRNWKQSKRWRLKGVLIPLIIFNVTGQVNGAVEGTYNLILVLFSQVVAV